MSSYFYRTPEILGTGQSLTTTGDRGQWRPLAQPYEMNEFNVLVTTLTAGASVVRLDWRPTVGSDTGRVNGLAIVNIPAASPVGRVFKDDGVRFLGRPGGEFVATVTTAATAGAVDLGIWGSHCYENPANNANVVVM